MFEGFQLKSKVKSRPRLKTRTKAKKSLVLKAALFAVSFFLLLLNLTAQAKETEIEYSTTPLRIAVAANFSPVLKQLLISFEQQTGIKSQMITASTGVLFQQIQHGAPFDMYLAADSKRPILLANADLIVENSRKTYALGQLALWSSTQSLNSLEVLKNTEQRLAIANPKTAPYGMAAKQALEYLNLWPSYQKKIIQGINVNQTFQQVRSKAVGFGLVSYSQLVLNGLSGILIPNDHYQPITQQLVILKSSLARNNMKKAKMLSDFLLSHASQQKINKFGYRSLNILENQ